MSETKIVSAIGAATEHKAIFYFHPNEYDINEQCNKLGNIVTIIGGSIKERADVTRCLIEKKLATRDVQHIFCLLSEKNINHPDWGWVAPADKKLLCQDELENVTTFLTHRDYTNDKPFTNCVILDDLSDSDIQMNSNPVKTLCQNSRSMGCSCIMNSSSVQPFALLTTAFKHRCYYSIATYADVFFVFPTLSEKDLKCFFQISIHDFFSDHIHACKYFLHQFHRLTNQPHACCVIQIDLFSKIIFCKFIACID